LFERVSPDTIVLADEEIDLPAAECRVFREPFRKEHGGRKAAAAALMFYLRTFAPFPPEAFENAMA
jgi:hypothetical protein